MSDEAASAPSNFLRDLIAADVASGKHGGRVVTRFPPEPNGYLHVGHVRAICTNFGLAEHFGGRCHLRFDDTNPGVEEERYVEGMREDIAWLGYDWGDHLYFTSDYFETLYGWAEHLIRAGKAFVCDLSVDEMRAYGGTRTEPGRESPYRKRSVEENLDLFARMRAGEFDEGSRVLRAKIDMSSSVMPMRDPILWRIQKAVHHHTGAAWNLYPMYAFAHPLSDAIEGVTHSFCSAEFTDLRPLYAWMIENCPVPAHPEQTEFARLNLSHTIVSKRRLRRLVEDGHVAGWDDPRMPTLRGLRRRGVRPESIRSFAEGVGLTRREMTAELSRLEHQVREDLNRHSLRVMAVLDPLKVVITNYPEADEDAFPAVNNPEDESAGTRPVPFSRELYIEREDFLEDPPKKFFRLAPGREVRLRAACLITCDEVVKNDAGDVVELRCSWDPESRGGNAPDGRRVKGTLHWVSARHALEAEVRLYEPLFSDPNPEAGDGDFVEKLNPDSLRVLSRCFVEPSVAGAEPGTQFQFERLGYFCVDPDSTPTQLVFNRTVTLRDAWAREQKKGR